MHKISKNVLKHVVIRHNQRKQMNKIRHEAKINNIVNSIIKSSNNNTLADDRCKLTRR